MNPKAKPDNIKPWTIKPAIASGLCTIVLLGTALLSSNYLTKTNREFGVKILLFLAGVSSAVSLNLMVAKKEQESEQTSTTLKTAPSCIKTTGEIYINSEASEKNDTVNATSSKKQTQQVIKTPQSPLIKSTDYKFQIAASPPDRRYLTKPEDNLKRSGRLPPLGSFYLGLVMAGLFMPFMLFTSSLFASLNRRYDAPVQNGISLEEPPKSTSPSPQTSTSPETPSPVATLNPIPSPSPVASESPSPQPVNFMTRGNNYQSESGNIVFLNPTSACHNDTINYSSSAEGITFEGTLAITNVEGCGTQIIRINGDFRAQNHEQKKWCQGKLTLTLEPQKGQAEWSSITNVKDWNCPVGGKSITLPLVPVKS